MNKNKFWINVILIAVVFLAVSCTPAVSPPNIPTELPVISTIAVEQTSTVQPTFTLPATSTILPTSTNSPTVQPSTTNQPTSILQPTATVPVVADDFQVHFVDVGQGDAELVITPHGNTILIDGGEKESGIIAYLAKVGIKKIDIMVATHPHSDHIGGLVEVLNSIPVAEVITTGASNTTDLFMDFLTGIETAKAQYVEMSRGETFAIDGITFTAIYPPNSFTSDDLNQTSLVLRTTFDDVTFLFAGDAGTEAEQEELASGLQLKADILKVAHHGSSTSTSAAFLKAVAPKVAIYSAGVNNQFNHPSPETVDRILAQGIVLDGTDVNGTVIVTVNETGYNVTLSRGGPRGTAVNAPTNTPSPPISTIPVVLPTTTKISLPTATKAVLPTSQPTKPASTALFVSVVSLTSPIKAGATAKLVVKTSPAANCTITVYYKSGPSSASGLGAKQADGSGNCSWSWKVGPSTAAGTWSITVVASAGGPSTSIQIPFVVTR